VLPFGGSVLRRSRKPITIASRRSELARVQAEMVGRGLRRVHPSLQIEFLWIESDGDRVTDRSLAELGHEAGGKGLFVKAVDQAVLDGKADLAVHSLKDVPCDTFASGLALAAVPKRAEVRDVLLTRHEAGQLQELPEHAAIGTASPRRAAQLLRLRGDYKIHLIRGNVPTRVSKVLGDDAESSEVPAYDATLLAAAGLARLGLKQHTKKLIDLDTVLPAAGQGALAIHCRADDHVTLTRCLPLNHAATSTAVHAERELVSMLGAGCDSPIAVLAQPTDPPSGEAKRNADAHWFRLRARVLASDGQQCLEIDETVRTPELRRLIKRSVGELNQQGAQNLLTGIPVVIGPAL